MFPLRVCYGMEKRERRDAQREIVAGVELQSCPKDYAAMEQEG